MVPRRRARPVRGYPADGVGHRSSRKVRGRVLIRILVVEHEATVLRAVDLERARIEGDNRLVGGRDRERVEVTAYHRGEQVDVALKHVSILEMFAGPARELGPHI